MPVTGTKRRAPRLRTGRSESEHRHATWFELFYDLVFVVIVAQLAHRLAGDVSWRGLAEFVALFVPVWWAWIGEAYYSTRFDSDADLTHRVLGSLQLIALVVLAASVDHALEGESRVFAGAYAFVKTVQVIQYLRAGYYLPQARPFVRHYATGLSAGAAVWWISLLLPEPWRFALWAVGFLIEVGTPLTAGSLHVRFPPNVTHIPERFGLFTILVLGEAVAGVVLGLAETGWRFEVTMTALLGAALALGLWWTYFNRLDDDAVRQLAGKGRTWLIRRGSTPISRSSSPLPWRP